MDLVTPMLKRMALECGEDTPLHEAAFVGDHERLAELLFEEDYQDQINNKNRLGCTPLRLAASGGHSECVRILLECNANVNLSDVKAQTPLAVAVKKKNITSVQLLLQAGAQPDGDSQNLWTPLYLASMEGYLDAVKALVQHGANINGWMTETGYFGTGTLYISIAYHHWDCFMYLMLHGGDPDSITRGRRQSHLWNESLYHSVIRHNVSPKFAQLLYDCGANLFYRNDKNLLPNEMHNNNECMELVKTFYENVRSLKAWCRLVIRQNLGQRGVFNTDDLPLPTKLVRYLNFEYLCEDSDMKR